MKPKLLILYNKLLHYRMPIFNILSQHYEVTVAYSYGCEPKCDMNFKRIKLTPYKVWKFTLHRENIFKLCNKFDVVLAYGETSYLKYSFLALHPNRHFKLIYWNIGAPASYTRHYGEGSRLYFAYTYFFQRRAEAHVSYAEEGRKLHIKHGFNPKMLFVANNTVEVPKIEKNRKRNSIMFIGTLYPQKGIPILLDAYKSAYTKKHNVLPLNIVGDGIMSDEISVWIKEHHLEKKINMLGALYSAEEKATVFAQAYACISPNQAGLAVLESMGYGVPFITSKNAITGGEAFNIDGKNGLRLESLESLSDTILDISSNPSKYEEMGSKAYDHYWSNRTPQGMANGLMDAIDYVLSRK